MSRAALVWLLVALPAAADEAAKPPSVEILPQSSPYVALMRVRDALPGTTRNWYVEPRPADVRLYGGSVDGVGRVVSLTGPPGTYTVTVRIGKPGKADTDVVDESVTAVVTLGGVPPVPPGPGPGPQPPPVPPPPAPVDPLTQSIRAAAQADGWPPAKLAALASAFKAAADVTVPGRTAAESQQARKRVLSQSLPEGVPANLAAVVTAVQKEADAFLPPSDPTHVVTADDAAKVKAIYGRLAAACLEATR